MEKKQLLAAFLLVTGYHLRSGKHLLSHSHERNAPSRGKGLRRYGPEAQQALEIVWNAANRMCSKRLIPFLSELVPLARTPWVCAPDT